MKRALFATLVLLYATPISVEIPVAPRSTGPRDYAAFVQQLEQDEKKEYSSSIPSIYTRLSTYKPRTQTRGELPLVSTDLQACTQQQFKEFLEKRSDFINKYYNTLYHRPHDEQPSGGCYPMSHLLVNEMKKHDIEAKVVKPSKFHWGIHINIDNTLFYLDRTTAQFL